MARTRLIVSYLAEKYVMSADWKRGCISYEWVDTITQELNLRNLTDDELANMWDMVYLTLDHEYNYFNENGDYKLAMKYLDAQSAFTEVVNVEARRRKGMN